MPKRTGLFIGRFQPLHRGHLLMIKKLASKVERLVVGIGSANIAPSCRNPFTAQERSEMLKRGMKEIGVRNCEIVELPDMGSDAQWLANIKRVVGHFDVAWSGSEWVLRIFKQHSLPVERIKEFPELSATKIRKRMVQGLPWLRFVPLSARLYLREISAAKRVCQLCTRH